MNTARFLNFVWPLPETLQKLSISKIFSQQGLGEISIICAVSLTTQKWSFLLRISSVNVTKSAGNCDLVTFTEDILNGKLHFLCSVFYNFSGFQFSVKYWKALKIMGAFARKLFWNLGFLFDSTPLQLYTRISVRLLESILDY